MQIFSFLFLVLYRYNYFGRGRGRGEGGTPNNIKNPSSLPHLPSGNHQRVLYLGAGSVLLTHAFFTFHLEGRPCGLSDSRHLHNALQVHRAVTNGKRSLLSP